MEYYKVIGKTGTYGQFKLVTWFEVGKQFKYGPPIALYLENGDGTVDVTLYTAEGEGHTRELPYEPRRISDICQAHLEARGFTTLRGEVVDVRAYND
jgi:hypothetical protein